MAIDSISEDAIRRVAEKVFGDGTAVTCLRAIAPSKSHGITETPPSTRNLLYVVDIEGHPESYVFRFSRVEDDVYEQEVRNYELLADETGVPVPTIYGLDTSGEIVPTAYMVMDYLHGKLWNYAAHPDNPNTSTAHKAQIGEAVGRFYARVHEIRREADEVGSEAQTILYTMDRLEAAAERGNVRATPGEIDRCREAVLQEPAFQQDNVCLCLADTEVHVAKNDDEWDIAFVCDAEWVEFRHCYSDLSQMLTGPRPWWKLDRPAPDLDPDAVAAQPFFRGYDPDETLDYSELLRLSAYYQLGLWAYVAMSAWSPAKIAWVRDMNGPLIQKLIQIISEQPEPVRSAVAAR